MTAAERDARRTRQYLLARFWDAGLGFWRRGAGSTAWILTLALVAITVVNVVVQYGVNVWYRAMFDAIDRRDAHGVVRQSLVFLPLTVANVTLAVAALHARMTTQRRWREWLNGHILDRWLTGGRYYQLNLVADDH